MDTRLRQLRQMGQSPWIDHITRHLIQSGGLQQFIARGITGLTANPTIFAQAVMSSADYDAAIGDLAEAGAGRSQIYEALIVEDMRAAADILRPLYDQTAGVDGYVSIEVSPKLAHDTQATIAEARRYVHAVGRPNVFVKVPATAAGIPAIRRLIGEGINVNITLIFAVEYYERVMEAYLAGLEQAAANGRPLDKIASVASFFVSRVDGEVDKRLDVLLGAARDETTRKALADLRGKAAIANARIAYQHFLRTFGGERFRALKAAGARVQRPLWASTSTKNPDYRDVRYVEELIGPDTVNTMPPATIAAFEDHGRVERTIDTDVEAAYATIERLQEVGIEMQEVTDKLRVDGITIFANSFQQLDRVIQEKRAALLAARAPGLTRGARV